VGKVVMVLSDAVAVAVVQELLVAQVVVVEMAE
jgi:hypothetical protein